MLIADEPGPWWPGFFFSPNTPRPQHPTAICDCQSERLCYAFGMGAITFERAGAVLVVLGVLLAAGERCVVAGSDMAALRDRLRRAGVGS